MKKPLDMLTRDAEKCLVEHHYAMNTIKRYRIRRSQFSRYCDEKVFPILLGKTVRIILLKNSARKSVALGKLAVTLDAPL